MLGKWQKDGRKCIPGKEGKITLTNKSTRQGISYSCFSQPKVKNPAFSVGFSAKFVTCYACITYTYTLK